MARLPNNIRQKVEAIAFGEEITEDPFLTGKTPKLTGYQTFYKIRVGDCRIGLHIDSAEELFEFQRVLHGREIYRKFP
jgi:mRNA interferase RelE/StbE